MSFEKWKKGDLDVYYINFKVIVVKTKYKSFPHVIFIKESLVHSIYNIVFFKSQIKVFVPNIKMSCVIRTKFSFQHHKTYKYF